MQPTGSGVTVPPPKKVKPVVVWVAKDGTLSDLRRDAQALVDALQTPFWADEMNKLRRTLDGLAKGDAKNAGD